MGMERDGAVGVAALGTIFEVALDGASDVGQLAANLMVTPGVKVDVEEVITARGDRYLAVFEACQLGIGSCGAEDIALVALLILDEPVLESAGRLGRSVLDHRPIVLLELTGTHFLHHAAQGLGGLGQQDDTRHRTVKTVDDFGHLVMDPTFGPVYYVYLLDLEDAIFSMRK